MLPSRSSSQTFSGSSSGLSLWAGYSRYWHSLIFTRNCLLILNLLLLLKLCLMLRVRIQSLYPWSSFLVCVIILKGSVVYVVTLCFLLVVFVSLYNSMHLQYCWQVIKSFTSTMQGHNKAGVKVSHKWLHVWPHSHRTHKSYLSLEMRLLPQLMYLNVTQSSVASKHFVVWAIL